MIGYYEQTIERGYAIRLQTPVATFSLIHVVVNNVEPMQMPLELKEALALD